MRDTYMYHGDMIPVFTTFLDTEKKCPADVLSLEYQYIIYCQAKPSQAPAPAQLAGFS